MTRTKRIWKARIAGGLIALSGLGMIGCKHQLLGEPADSPLLKRTNIPAELETRTHNAIPPGPVSTGTDPATVLDLKRQTRPLSLKEAIAIAIEQGNTGSQGGQGQDVIQPSGSAGRSVSSDTIKAFVLDPAVAAAEVERSVSKFDARWITSMIWSKTDTATLTLQQSFSNGDGAAFTSTLAKPLPTGGVAGITTSMNYLKLSNAPTNSGFVALSTSYTPRVQFVFEQPLLQGFGVEANQLLTNHPGSLLISGFQATGAGGEGILISRLRAEQSKETFNSQINQMLLNVEVAYWNLYAAYYALYAQEEGLKESFKALNFNRPRVDKGIEEPQLLPQLEAQYFQFFNGVIQSRGQVLEADRALRGLLGMKSDDGTIFAPNDEPVKSPFKVDFQSAHQEGLENRPEIILARQDLKIQQLNLRAQKYGRMADLRFFSSYDINGLGSGLTGDEITGANSNAFSSIRANNFNSWQLGLRLNMPLGFRDANALVRTAQLNLWRSWYTLNDSERKLYEAITQAKRQMDQSYAQIQINQKGREALQRQVALIDSRIKAGQFQGGAAYVQLTQAQQNLASAINNEFRAVADYNSALARLEFAKGSIQRYNNISVSDGPLPAFVEKKATDHFRSRQAALKLREHPADPVQSGQIGGFQFAPLGQMNDQMLAAPAPSAPVSLPPVLTQPQAGPSPTPAPVTAPKPTTPTSTIKSWDTWQSTPSGTGASLPATLPSATPASIPTSAPLSGFQPDGTLSLPKRGLPASAPTVPTTPATIPQPTDPTAPRLPAMLPGK